MLDSEPLGQLARRKPLSELLAWTIRVVAAGAAILVPEVADYEVRRNLLLHSLKHSISELDRLKSSLVYLPITTSAMLRAAGLWADARRVGKPTADPRELDCDVLLAAQALEAGAIVATENVGHLSRYVVAKHWRDIDGQP